MKFTSTKWMRFAALLAVLALLTSCGLRRKKYENPITKDTLQPDKQLFDKSIKDIEKGRYEIARLTLEERASRRKTQPQPGSSSFSLKLRPSPRTSELHGERRDFSANERIPR